MRTLPVFLHIPRCAGTSLRNQIEGRFHRWEVLRHDDSSSMEGLRSNILDAGPLRLAAGHFEYRALEPLQSKYNLAWFTFLRDPIARVISDWHWARTSAMHRFHQECQQNLDDCLMYGTYPQDNLMVRLLGSCVDVPKGKITYADFRRAKSVLESFVFVGDVANYKDDAAELADCFDWEPIGIEHANKLQESRPEAAAVDDLTGLIASHNELDLRLYEEW